MDQRSSPVPDRTGDRRASAAIQLLEKNDAPATVLDGWIWDTELKGFGLAVMEDTKTISPNMAAAIRLLLLTGCRKSEILSLRWSFVDAGRSCLRLPDSIGALLDHADSTISRYAHLSADPLKAAADRTSLRSRR